MKFHEKEHWLYNISAKMVVERGHGGRDGCQGLNLRSYH